ncbi:unnamed protein product [Psylliodes chrysocephalus]|uniref:(S)-2-hydroxy-acid oxidase n=1 Tax=Psylliodes chrysocephalus TaxID=3402493 RepID=A0A9P0GFV7_9CUCU|nr:unnamed protein product [Psylliodes chrysocephala]
MTTNNLIRIKDYEANAKKLLPKAAFEFFGEGTGHEDTLKNNLESYKRYRIRPRYLRNVEQRTMRKKILGKDVAIPIGLSPTAIQKLAHKDGECAAAKAAEELGTIYILSLHSTSTMEEVTQAAPKGRKWLQCYIFKVREVAQEIINTAERLGFEGIVLTVDFPVLGSRNIIAQYGHPLPYYLKKAILEKYLDSGIISNSAEVTDPSADWSCIKWLKSITKLPIIAKGILTAEDAILAVEAGVSAILVSNHGARQLDGVPSTIESLPEIVSAVGDKVEVYVDGGIRDGTDVFKALGLGAKMVFIGRPIVWGLFHNGEQGVKNVLTILRNELDKAMAISGCAGLDDITKDKVIHESHYSKI